MFEILCAVLVVTVIGLTWNIWKPILMWAAIVATLLAVIAGLILTTIFLWQQFDTFRAFAYLGLILIGIITFFATADQLLHRFGLADGAMSLHKGAPWFCGIAITAIFVGLLVLFIK